MQRAEVDGNILIGSSAALLILHCPHRAVLSRERDNGSKAN